MITWNLRLKPCGCLIAGDRPGFVAFLERGQTRRATEPKYEWRTCFRCEGRMYVPDEPPSLEERAALIANGRRAARSRAISDARTRRSRHRWVDPDDDHETELPELLRFGGQS